MDVITVNRETCTRCGICSTVCTSSLIDRDEDNFPTAIPETDAFCNRCGACVAVCPNGSLAHIDFPPDQMPKIDPAHKVTLEQCAQLVMGRRSVRVYKDQPVPREELNRLLDITRYSPTGGNLQEVKYLVIDDPAVMQKLRDFGREFVIDTVKTIPVYAPRLKQFEKRRDAGFDIFLHGAPVLVNTWGEANMPITSIDSTIALSYFDLLATSAGLGCCWLGFFSAAANNHPEVKKILNLPEGSQVYGSMVVGYPKFNYPRVPARKEAAITWL